MNIVLNKAMGIEPALSTSLADLNDGYFHFVYQHSQAGRSLESMVVDSENLYYDKTTGTENL